MRGTRTLACAAGLCALAAVRPAAGQLSTYPVVYNFTGGHDGAFPFALIQGADGNLYGTADGLSGNRGAVYSLTTSGALSVLHEFSGTDGIGPGALVQTGDGLLYGTTSFGGGPTSTGGYGTIFQISTGGAFQLLHAFNGADGQEPNGLTQASNGNLYGSAALGGANNMGSLFGFGPADGSFTLLHSFSGSDGVQPRAGLTFIPGRAIGSGNLFGTTVSGGDSYTSPTQTGHGSVFRYFTSFEAPSDADFSTAWSFVGGTDGEQPTAITALGATPDLYGVTGNYSIADLGTVYHLAPDGSSLTTLHTFTGTDGIQPSSAPILASDGYLYGTTAFGGPNYNGMILGGGAPGNAGTVYRMRPDGSGFQTVYAFSGPDGSAPISLLQATDGNLYGAAQGGGASGLGTVFVVDLTPPTTIESEAGPAGQNNWYTGPVTVTLTATDTLSGVAATYYTLNTSPPQTYSGPFTISADGTYTMNYWSVDRAGNTEQPHTAAIRIDSHPPSTSLTLTPPPNAAGWNNTFVDYEVLALDDQNGNHNGSGMGSITFAEMGAENYPTTTFANDPLSFNEGLVGFIVSEGSTTITYFATDRAGNSSAPQSATINIDLTPPVITAQCSPRSAKAGRRLANVTVHGTAADALSGVNPASGTYAVQDSEGTTVPGGTFTIASDGSYSFKLQLSTGVQSLLSPRVYTIAVSAQDMAGNFGSAVTAFTVR